MDTREEEKRFSYLVRESGKITIVDFIGELDMHTLPDAVELTNNLIANEKVDILVNLSKLRYIDSSGLGFFTGTLKKLQRYSGDMKLANLSSYIARIFSLIHLDYFIEIHDSVDAALQAFRDTSAVAEKKWKRIIEITPEYPDAYYNLGIVYRNQGALDKAVIEFKKALEINPRYAECHNALGEVLWDRGNQDGAIECFRKAIELNPKMADSLFNLGRAYNNRNMLSEAVQEYRKAVELNPNYADFRMKYGLVLKKTGRTEEAAAEFLQALAINPAYVDAHYQLARLYYDLNDFDAAMPHLLKVKEMAVNSERAIEVSQLIDEIGALWANS
jgi:anti-anti-sigma factor